MIYPGKSSQIWTEAFWFLYTEKPMPSNLPISWVWSCPGWTLSATFTSGLSREVRNVITAAFREQAIRVLITTTSLKMGVNFPATDVIVRDTYFHGSGRLPLRDILQMTGRAGRGNTMGRAWILCDRSDYADFYKEGLESGRIEPLEPQLMRANSQELAWRQKVKISQVNPIRALLLSELAAHKDGTIGDITVYLAKTYSASCGRFHPESLSENFRFLEDGKLIYKVEGSEDRYAVTKLGKTVCICGISPESGDILPGFLTRLIRLNERRKDAGQDPPRYLSRLTDLDFLFLAVSGFEVRDSWVGAPSKESGNPGPGVPGNAFTRRETPGQFVEIRKTKDPTRRLLSQPKRIPSHEVGKKNAERSATR